MDRCHRSAIYKGSRITHRIPNSTQYDARQRCSALIVLKEENNNNLLTYVNPILCLQFTSCRRCSVYCKQSFMS